MQLSLFQNVAPKKLLSSNKDQKEALVSKSQSNKASPTRTGANFPSRKPVPPAKPKDLNLKNMHLKQQVRHACINWLLDIWSNILSSTSSQFSILIVVSSMPLYIWPHEGSKAWAHRIRPQFHCISQLVLDT